MEQVEEDVPEDFFDDFLDDDFMEGLNVVDEWDEDDSSNKSDKNIRLKTYSEKNELKSKHSPIRFIADNIDKNEKEHSKSNHDKSKIGKRSRSNEGGRKRRSWDKERTGRNVSTIKNNSIEKNTAKDNYQRRDPVKTRRDILRDKDKCAKNKENKIISEKLRVVETGLVPPGTEMEFDFKKCNYRSPSFKDISVDVRSRIIESSYEHKLSRSPQKKRSRSSLNRIETVFKDESARRRYINRRRTRSRSKGASPMSEREMWLHIRGNRSPKRQRKRSRSISSNRNTSKWGVKLSPPRHKRHERDRSLSSSRKKSKSFLEELDDKLSKNMKQMNFLQEIHQKINASSSNSVPNMQMMAPYSGAPGHMPGFSHHPNMMPQAGMGPHIPIMGPMPGVLHPQNYDQSFFIGHHNPMSFQPVPDYGTPANQFIPQLQEIRTIPEPVPPPEQNNIPFDQISQLISVNQFQTSTYFNEKKDKEYIKKVSTVLFLILIYANYIFFQLFNDEKISLTDYLAITSNSTGLFYFYLIYISGF